MRIGRAEATLNIAVLSLFSLLALIPLVGVILSALTPSAENAGGFELPSRIDFGNFAAAWNQGRFGTYLLSSAIVTVSVVVLTVVLSVLAGYAFARLRFPGSGVLFFVLLAGLSIPAEAFVIPLYFDLRSLGLTDSYWALILPQTAQSLAFGVFWMRTQFRTFPGEILDAARVDGARDLRVLWQVLVPPSTAPIMTMAVLVAMWTWNEFLLPLVLIVSDEYRTAPLGLAFFQGAHLTDYSLLSAGGVLVALPIALLYFALQRRFISGMVGGVAVR